MRISVHIALATVRTSVRVVSATTLIGASAVVAPALAQQPQQCGAPFHQFDFWIGDWDVTDQGGGTVFGRNVITPIAGGCGIREHWTSGSFDGVSINMYDPVRDDWTQVWMDENPLTLHLQGGWTGSAMVLQGPRVGGGFNRITWTPLQDGRVRQHWEESQNGNTWTTVFDGYYRRRGTPPG
jgi:hypothetical protein